MTNKLFNPLNKRRSILIFLASLITGGFSVLSIYFHFGLLQNFDLFEKAVLLSLGIIPLALLFIFLLNCIFSIHSLKTSIVAGLFSICLSFGIIAFLYTTPDLVKNHTLSVEIPLKMNGADNQPFSFTKIEVQNGINKELTLNPFKIKEESHSTKTDKYYPGMVLEANIKFSGNMVVFSQSKSCPNYIIVTEGDSSFEKDLCKIDPQKGFMISNSSLGSVLPKWLIVAKVMRFIDFITLFTIISILLFLLITLISKQKKSQSELSFNQFDSNSRFTFFGTLILSSFSILLLVSGFIWFPVYILFLIIEIVLLVSLTIKIAFGITIPGYLFILLMLFGGIILRVSARDEFKNNLLPIARSSYHSQYSFNALLNQILGFPTYEILYGYGDVLFGRDLNISKSTAEEIGFSGEIIVHKSMVNNIYYSDMSPLISENEFHCLSKLSYRDWNDTSENHYFFFDEKYYEDGEAVKVVQFENTLLFIPDSYGKTKEICK